MKGRATLFRATAMIVLMSAGQLCADGPALSILLRGEGATESAPHGGGNVYAPEVHRDEVSWLMWYGGQGADGHDRIHLAQSADGARWTKRGVVVDCGTANHVNDPTVVRAERVWWMFYTVAESGEHDEIAAATSPDGMTWKKLGVVLGRGAGTAWDSAKVGRPSVLREKGIFKMWYDGQPGAEAAAASATAARVKAQGRAVGYAESKDGLHWVRRQEPVFGEGAGAVQVLRRGADYLMVFESGTGTRVAASRDGLSWTPCGALTGLSGGAEDRFGQVTPFFLPDATGSAGRLFFGAASHASWDHNSIGVFTITLLQPIKPK